MRMLSRVCLAVLMSAAAIPALAQSPNTAALVVVVVDQSGAVVSDAKVTVINSATGATRDAVSSADGAADHRRAAADRHLHGQRHQVRFTADDVTDLTLRAGETATVKVKLVASGGKTEVVVYGTTQGVRADAQIGLRLDSRDDRRDADPRPQGHDAAAVQLRVPAGQRHRRPVRQRHLLHHRRRQPAHDHVHARRRQQRRGWGRQTMIATVPIGAIQEMSVLSNAFSAEFGWTAGPALNIVTKSGTNALHGEGLYLGRPGGMQAKTFVDEHFCAPAVPTCVDADDADRDQSGRCP